jgi:hypothetical protein
LDRSLTILAAAVVRKLGKILPSLAQLGDDPWHEAHDDGGRADFVSSLEGVKVDGVHLAAFPFSVSRYLIGRYVGQWLGHTAGQIGPSAGGV